MNRLTTRTIGWTAGLAGLAVLAACAAQQPQTRVTRFHLPQPIAPGQITIEGHTPEETASLEFKAYAAPVAAELARNGFTIAPGLSQSEMVAVLDIHRETREGYPEQAPLSVGIGGGGLIGGGGRRGGGGVGLGGGVSFPVGKARSRYVTMTDLGIQLKRRSDATVFWEGHAQQAARADAPQADATTAATSLAHALFLGFPGESGRTITVK